MDGAWVAGSGGEDGGLRWRCVIEWEGCWGHESVCDCGGEALMEG